MRRSGFIGFLEFVPVLTVLLLGWALCARTALGGGEPYAAERNLIEVMFAPEAQVRMRAGTPVDLKTDALAGVDAVLAGVDHFEWHRICDVSEQRLDEICSRGKLNSGTEIYNLNNIYRLFFESSRGLDVWTLCAQLEALPGVFSARPVPKPTPAPLPPDYQPIQNYEDPAAAVPTGVDAEFAWTQAGGNGSGITICDVEYSWNYNHNDVTKALGSQINFNVSDPFSDNNHGTAVVGELVSDDNAPNWGTKGVCYGAGLKTCGSYYGFPTPSWNVPGAIAVAVASLSAGDVILLEQQWDYTGSQGYVPIEWWTNTAPSGQSNNAVYAAIVNAVASGIHVVEAGGNGNINTDLLTWFGDSGAIIVGAGGAYTGGTYPEGNLERLSFSSYGSRFNLQGWGENVVTTGYGALFNTEGVNRYYTAGFGGTSSASPIVAGALACCEGYWLANMSPTPLSPLAMRTLLVNTGTPQFFGLIGNIGPRPNISAAIAAMVPQQYYDYGDAPEYAPAYPAMGVIGMFPTCTTVGPPGSFVRHGNPGLAYFGPSFDLEMDGNAGNCPNFPPYDADECWSDGDAGLLFPPAYTINPALAIVPCNPQHTGCLGMVCSAAQWGVNLDIMVVNTGPQAFVNVLMDWDQNGMWAGSAQCPQGAAPEHVLLNFPVPAGFSGPLSALGPPGFTIGPNSGFAWTRFTLSDAAVPFGWNGAGAFMMGETCDYLLCIEPEHRSKDYGDAPEGAIAYPTGILGQFPTCVTAGPAGYVAHQSTGLLYFGPSVDLEPEGNAGNCPNFPPYDADECANDGDAGLLAPGSYTLAPGGLPVACPLTAPVPLGLTCNPANWGPSVDILVTNSTGTDAYVNVLMDWNQDGRWQGASLCPAGAAPEHVLVNFLLPSGFAGPLSLLVPPPFMIGPNSDFVWTRFTLSERPVQTGWDGSGDFQDGETCDYLLRVERDLTGALPMESPVTTTRLLGCMPNPVNGSATLRMELGSAGRVTVTVFDVAGRAVRTLLDETRGAGRFGVVWDGRDAAGEHVATGMYFVRLNTGGRTYSTPIVVLE